MAARKRTPSPTPSEGRSMRSFIRKPARFRSPQDPANRRSSSLMDTDSIDSSAQPAAKRGPGRPRGSTTKRKRSSSTSPPVLSSQVYQPYQPAAFPSRPMRETPEERKVFDDATRAAMLAKFEEEDDGFGDEWADVEPGPALEVLHPERHIVPVFESRAKRACLANKSFEEFFRKQILEIHDGTVPVTIGRAMAHTALEMCWRGLATKVFGEDVNELEDVVAKIVKEVVKNQVSPRDSHSPRDTIAVKPKPEKSAPQPTTQAPYPRPFNASPQNVFGPASSLDVTTDDQAVSVVEQYQEWKRHANRPLDVRMVMGVRYGNQGWNIDHPRRRPFATKDWRIHPQFGGNEQLLSISDGE